MRLNREELPKFQFQGVTYVAQPVIRAAMFILKGKLEAQKMLLANALAAGTAQAWTHAFEKAGLGLYPFHCDGFTKNVYTSHPGAPEQPGGSCDYCGTGIMLEFHIVSKDGRRFKVGSDCVCKTGDVGLRKEMTSLPEVRAARRAAVAAQAEKDFETLKEILADEAFCAVLAGAPHPRGFVDRNTGQPLTRLDWARWMFDHSGRTGRKALLKALCNDHAAMAEEQSHAEAMEDAFGPHGQG
jgi:hypothetical protein